MSRAGGNAGCPNCASSSFSRCHRANTSGRNLFARIDFHENRLSRRRDHGLRKSAPCRRDPRPRRSGTDRESRSWRRERSRMAPAGADGLGRRRKRSCGRVAERSEQRAALAGPIATEFATSSRRPRRIKRTRAPKQHAVSRALSLANRQPAHPCGISTGWTTWCNEPPRLTVCERSTATYAVKRQRT